MILKFKNGNNKKLLVSVLVVGVVIVLGSISAQTPPYQEFRLA